MYFQDFSCKSKVARQIKLKKYFTNCTKFKSLTNWCNRLVILWIVSEVVSSTSYIRDSIENRTFCTKHFVYVLSKNLYWTVFTAFTKSCKNSQVKFLLQFFSRFCLLPNNPPILFPPGRRGEADKMENSAHLRLPFRIPETLALCNRAPIF